VPALDVPEEHEIRVSNVPATASSLAAVPLSALGSFEFIPVQPTTNVSRKRRIETLVVNILPFLLMVDLHILHAA